MKSTRKYLAAVLFIVILCCLFILYRELSVSHSLSFIPSAANTADASASLGSGMIAHYTLDEGSGTAVGDSAGSNAGTMVGSPAWTAGKIGQALTFDGTDAVAIGPMPGTSGLSAISVSAWVRKSSASDTAFQDIVSKSTSVFWDDWELGKSSSIFFNIFSNTGGFHSAQATKSLPADTSWHLATGVYDGSAITMYVDGSAGTPVAFTGQIGNVIPGACIGSESSRNGVCTPGPTAFKGDIDDVRIYNRALTSDEIAALYSQGGGTPPSSPDTSTPPASTPPPPPPPPTTPPSAPIGAPSNPTTPASDTSTPTTTPPVTTPPVTTPPDHTVGILPNATHIGSSSFIDLPTSALWESDINFTPGQGEAVTVNPPRFTWTYNPDPSVDDCSNGIICMNWAPREFILQAAASPSDLQSQQNLLVNIRTPYNFYNYLDHFNVSTVYWRVGYVQPASSNIITWDPSSPSTWSNTIIWSAVRNFSISGATIWDRKYLSDAAYLSSKADHPHVLFNKTNRAALGSWLASNDPSDFTSLKNQAKSAEASSYWNNPPPGPASSLSYNVAIAAFVWQMTQDDSYLTANGKTSLVQALVNLATWYVSSGQYKVDPIIYGDYHDIKNIAYAYDWLYEKMTPAQRATVLNAIDLNARFLKTMFYNGFTSAGQHTACDFTDATQTCYASVYPASMFKNGHSHYASYMEMGVIPSLAAFGDSDNVRWMFDAEMNYMIGKSYPFGSDDGTNQGISYGFQLLFAPSEMYLYDNIAASITFPEMHFEKNPFWAGMADWWGRMLPVGVITSHDPWGEAGWGTYNQWAGYDFGRDLSYFLHDNVSYAHWQNQKAVTSNPPTTQTFPETIVPYYFPASGLSSVPSTVLSKVDPKEGWAFGCSGASNTTDCFQGVGFVFQARPRNAYATLGHAYYTDLTYQMWAYGVPITDGGDCVDPCNDHNTNWHYGILVNGQGQLERDFGPTDPYFARIYAFQTGSNYTYVAGDATKTYPIKAFGLSYTGQSSPAVLPFLQKVRRHILFVRNKYFIIFDDLGGSQPATYTSVFQVPGTTGVFSSNLSDASFSYQLSNIMPQDQYANNLAEKDTKVKVYFVNDPSELSIQDKGPLGSFIPKPHSFQISNATPAANFHFMSVIYPNPLSAADPVITRLDDYTVEVKDGTNDDVITFDPQSPFPATIAVDTLSQNPRPVADGAYGTSGTDIVTSATPTIIQSTPHIGSNTPSTPSTPSDTTPPSLTSITAASITTSGSVISWTTNENATTQVQYGLTTAYGNSSPLVSALATSHSVTLSNLLPNTAYHYKVISTDAAGNTSTSGDGVFSTLSSSPTTTPPPVSNTPPSDVTPQAQSNNDAASPNPAPSPVTTPPASLPPASFPAFTKYLKLGVTDPQVQELQQFLNAHGFYVSLTGIGSSGKETTYFGNLTYKAVVKFQNYYQSDVLTPSGLSRGTGYFGPATMGKVNMLLR